MKDNPNFDPSITLCTQKELCAHLNIGREFLLAMRYAGFPMPGRRSTVNDALAWLRANPDFRPCRVLELHRPSLATTPEDRLEAVRKYMKRTKAKLSRIGG